MAIKDRVLLLAYQGGFVFMSSLRSKCITLELNLTWLGNNSTHR